MELVVAETAGRESDRDDYVAFMHGDDMKQAGVGDGSYVMLANRARTVDGETGLELAVLVLRMTPRILGQLEPGVAASFKRGMIALDQTYRDALAAQSGTVVRLTGTAPRPTASDRFSSLMHFQRVILRTHLNHTYLERRVPMAGLCKEMATAIGVSYGDRVIISSPDNSRSISMICAPLTPSMQEFHDATTRIQDAGRVRTWSDPDRTGGVADVTKVADRLHPVFIDASNRRRLGIGVFSPVRVRRSFRWVFMKKLSSLAAMNLLAMPLMLFFIQEEVSNPLYWAVLAGMGGWLVWGILKSTTYSRLSEA